MYSLSIKKISQKTIQLTVCSIIFLLTINSIFCLSQAISLTRHVVNTERDVTFFIKTFPKVDNSLSFETLLQTSPQEILEKRFGLFYNKNQNFEKEKKKEFFTICCKIQ